MNKGTRFIVGTIAAISTIGLVTGCSIHEVNPDAIGLKYTAGSFDGKKFDGIVIPGDTAMMVNDDFYQLTTAQRSYIVRKDGGADVDGVISVPTGGSEEASGMLVDFEVSVAFKLNTRDNDIEGFEGGTIRKFFEDLCRHYGCQLNDGNDSDGWRDLLKEKLYPQLESAFKDEARGYSGDAIVNNTPIELENGEEGPGTLTVLQAAVGKRFGEYLVRQTGRPYFCGPSFDRNNSGDPSAQDPRLHPCPPVELLIISADYNNADIRKARDAKKVASDTARAQEQLEKALADPNYLEYLRVQAMTECTKSDKATCVFISGGGSNQVPVAVTPNPGG